MSEVADNTQEVWKTITKFPAYSVSNHGRVRRDAPCRRQPKGGLLKPTVDGNGYSYVSLCMNNNPIKEYIHRLVAKEFLEPDPNRPTVNHKMGVAFGNGVDNLEWATYGENNLHSYRQLGRKAPRGENHCRSHLTEENVVQIRAMIEGGMMDVDVAKIFNIGPRAIGYIKHRATWKHV